MFPLNLIVNGIKKHPRYSVLPINYEILNNHKYRLTVSIAGYDPNKIEILLEADKLIILSNSVEDLYVASYMHKGIAQRAFRLIFLIDGFTKIVNTQVHLGLLYIEMERNIPQDKIRILPNETYNLLT